MLAAILVTVTAPAASVRSPDNIAFVVMPAEVFAFAESGALRAPDAVMFDAMRVVDTMFATNFAEVTMPTRSLTIATPDATRMLSGVIPADMSNPAMRLPASVADDEMSAWMFATANIDADTFAFAVMDSAMSLTPETTGGKILRLAISKIRDGVAAITKSTPPTPTIPSVIL